MKHALVIALLLAGGCIRASHCAEEAKNLLKNSSFSLAANPGLPDFWAGQSGWRENTHHLVDDAYIPGTKSMQLSNWDGKDVPFRSGNYGWSPGKAGTVYTFSVSLKAAPAGIPALIGSERLEMKKVEVGDTWQRYTVTAPLKEGSGFSGRYLQVGVTLPASPKGVLFMNSPMLVQGSEPGAYVSEPAKKHSDVPAKKTSLKEALTGEWILEKTGDKDAQGNLLVKDTGSKGNHGTIVGRAEWADTPFGSAMKFDGKTYVLVPYTPALNGDPDELTIELLLKPDSGKTAPILCKGMHYGGYAMRIQYGKYWPIIGTWKDGPSTPVLPNLDHIVVTFRAPAAKIYVNGEQVGENEINGRMNPEAQKRFLVIGGFDVYSKEKGGYGPEPGFEGIIRLVRIYDKALSGEEVRNAYLLIRREGKQ